MQNRTRELTRAAVIAALYAVLTHLQNVILVGSASWANQFRLSEALCVLAFFTPAAIPGLSVGCLLFNLTFAGTLPLDALVGTLATLVATAAMWGTRRITIRGCPVPGMVMPALTNGVLVGWELSVYIGGAFWLNALSVAFGELVVLFTLGMLLWSAIKRRHLAHKLFS